MLVTRTEMFTDWSYKGAHMGEQAATVGVGLMTGHIYFRYADDFLKDGETIKRELSFVELSDGSNYELGAGASSEKITIIDHGLTSAGEVYLEVIGRPEIGVGVSRILRHVTIEYDDGKVPVLDTDQLNDVLKQLSDGLTQSMVDTANAVKQEVNARIDTAEIELEQKCNEAVNSMGEAVRHEIDEAIQGVDEVVGEWAESTSTSMDRINQRIDGLHIPTPVFMQCSTPGQYTIQSGDTVNLFHAQPNGMPANGPFTYRPNYKTISIAGGAVPYDRMLRVTFVSTLNVSDGAVGPLHVSLRNHTDEVSTQQIVYLDRGKMNNRIIRVQFSFETFIAANDSTHPALNNGFRLNGYNRSGAQVIFETSSAIMLTLLTA